MRKNYIKLGDIILIPIDGDRCGIAKIIYLSKYFKDVILLNIYPLIANFSEKVIELSANIPDELLIYTGNQNIKTEEWKKLNNIMVTDEEKRLSTRIVGGEVWIEDECIGTATEQDRKKINRMGVDGTKLVEDKIKDYLFNKGLL